jgi:hypothetical protein
MFGWTRETLDLDRPIDLRRIDTTTTKGAWELFLHTLSGAVAEDCGALHLFYHEADDLVRQVLWNAKSRRNVWAEYVPIAGAPGRQVLVRLRRVASLWWQPLDRVEGGIRVRREGKLRRVPLLSPHLWDVRLHLADQLPATLPYELVFTGQQVAGPPVLPWARHR